MKTGMPITLPGQGLSHDYHMTSVVLTGTANVHKSSHRATLCLTDLVRLAKKVRQQVYATSVPKQLSGLTKVTRNSCTSIFSSDTGFSSCRSVAAGRAASHRLNCGVAMSLSRSSAASHNRLLIKRVWQT